MALTNEHKEILLWLFQAISILLFFCAIIRLLFITKPPIHTLTDLTVPTNQGGNEFSVQECDEISQVITNPNKEGIFYDETKMILSQNGSVLVLLSANRSIFAENGTLKLGLQTTIRYKMIKWTTKRHSLSLEASIPVEEDGMFSIGKEGVKLKPVKVIRTDNNRYVQLVQFVLSCATR
ncbi:hypothetical protein Cgig2_028343 [Carnegiea gigantea]|uniref:Uncharacterized protein n=1 Tax=Carnegiea gigantea TaxID=171969 RepID=A0A9Q1QK46_9CARY|nr:hypothetical protein Cgig2_028341 [Carnegiea gigantea]KAJ8444528.1 hypothetical protein Cgig2_028343 [Carnegiea gigantea]